MATLIRDGPAPSRPRSPAVPKLSPCAKRSASSSQASRSSSARSSARASGSGSAAIQASTRARRVSVAVAPAMAVAGYSRMRPIDVIAAKRDGEELPADTLREFVLAYTRDDVADYQMAAFLMAGYLNGFSRAEAVALTAAMVASGDELDLSRLSGPTVDKHSTGGVGDGTTLVVAPLAAELGMQVVKLSGRGLGHTGGTLDKLDAIPGMRTELSGEELIAQVEAIGLAVCAQTADLVPADKAMYALRDVTATVDNVALIAASVMSKKLAGGAGAILLDVKTGSGAFMKELDDSRELAELCVALGEDNGRASGALITDMSQPLADAVGNASEISEAIEVLRGERTGRFADVCIALAGHMAALTGLAASGEQGIELAR